MKRSEMQSAEPVCCATVAVLFVRADSGYKGMAGVSCWDAERDALTFLGGMPVVAHPPCRAWGCLSHMAFRTPDWRGQDTAALQAEKQLALWAVTTVRKEGGVIEHPSGSRLFHGPLPDVNDGLDAWGGYTIEIDQWDFGHVAHKKTKLYVCGVCRAALPDLPPRRNGKPEKSIAGNVRGTKGCTQYEREYTPPELRAWLVEVARRTEMHNEVEK